MSVWLIVTVLQIGNIGTEESGSLAAFKTKEACERTIKSFDMHLPNKTYYCKQVLVTE